MKIFITGATGYIGGSIAARLLTEGHQVRGLVRDSQKSASLSELGVIPVTGTLDSSEVIRREATEADAVINTASSDHLGVVHTLIDALRGSGKPLLHTSGSSVVCDDARGEYESTEVYDDDSVIAAIPLRAARVEIDRTVRRAGIEDGIRSIVLCPSMIYGQGKGLQKQSDQIPKLMTVAREAGAGVFVGKGLNRWSNVHIDDLVDLYLLALTKAPSGSFFFAENGENALIDVAAGISHLLGFGGNTQSWRFDEAVARYGDWARFAIASNSRVRARNARALLGWMPAASSLITELMGGNNGNE